MCYSMPIYFFTHMHIILQPWHDNPQRVGILQIHKYAQLAKLSLVKSLSIPSVDSHVLLLGKSQKTTNFRWISLLILVSKSQFPLRKSHKKHQNTVIWVCLKMGYIHKKKHQKPSQYRNNTQQTTAVFQRFSEKLTFTMI